MAAETQSLEAPKPLGLEPGSAAYGLKTLPPNSKYAKVNAGGWLHYPALPTLKGQDTDTLLKVVFSGCSEVLTGAGGWVLTNPSGRHSGAILNHLRDSLCHCLRVPGSGGSY